MTEEVDRWQRLIDGLRTGDEQIAREFWNEYGPLLHRLTDRRLAEALRRRVEPEDVVQSAFRTFLRRVRVGQFHLEDRDDLWRLLCTITLNKLRWQTRFHLAAKRSLKQEDGAVHGAPIDEEGSPEAPGPTPAEAAEFSDQFRQLLSTLDEEEQQLVELKLQDYTNHEVAKQMRCSERTVRRILQRVKDRLARALEGP